MDRGKSTPFNTQHSALYQNTLYLANSEFLGTSFDDDKGRVNKVSLSALCGAEIETRRDYVHSSVTQYQTLNLSLDFYETRYRFVFTKCYRISVSVLKIRLMIHTSRTSRLNTFSPVMSIFSYRCWWNSAQKVINSIKVIAHAGHKRKYLSKSVKLLGCFCVQNYKRTK
jgi:hypothetical protein